MAATVRSVSDAVSEFLVAFGAASKNADQSSRRAIRIAAAAIIVAAISTLVQIGYSELRTQRNQLDTAAAINTIVSRLEGVQQVQRERMDRIGAELSKNNGAAKDGFDHLSAAIRALTELLRSQGQSSFSVQTDDGTAPSK